MKTSYLNYFTVILLVILSINPTVNFAQEKKNNAWNRLKTDAYYMGDGFLQVWTSPARWKKKDFLKLGGFVASAFLVSFLDEPVNDWAVRTNNPKRRESLENFADIVGKPGPAIISFSLIYGTGLIIDNQDIRDAGVVIFGSLAATALMQTISKTATGRARPITGLGYNYFEPFKGTPAFHSFPSGHTMSALTITTVFAGQINIKPIRYLLYGVGIATGFARVYNEAHWLSDVLVSGGITYLAVKTVEKRYAAKKALREGGAPPVEAKTKLNFTPYANGFRLSLRFN